MPGKTRKNRKSLIKARKAKQAGVRYVGPPRGTVEHFATETVKYGSGAANQASGGYSYYDPPRRRYY